MLQLPDQVLVGVGDRVDADVAAVGVADPHVVEAVRLDVLDLRIVDVGLQPAQPELGGEHGLGDRQLLVRGRHRLPRAHALSDQRVHAVLDERASQLLLRGRTQGRTSLELLGERGRRRLVQSAHERPVNLRPEGGQGPPQVELLSGHARVRSGAPVRGPGPAG